MEQLHPHRPQHRSPMQEEEVAAAARMLDRVLDEVDDSMRLELRAATEAEVTCALPRKARVRKTDLHRYSTIQQRSRSIIAYKIFSDNSEDSNKLLRIFLFGIAFS